ncbi:hypothetical protein JO379_000007 [Streptomyces syringium]|uniref:Uncharacterized protein n=1 Tax=Streptomyces syringium TaxID=76729 RepID=A0ABS4XVJ1_9ACTN|nr:hypothetical protein [Streptomyces syringium]
MDLTHQVGVLESVQVEAAGCKSGEFEGKVQGHQRVYEQIAASGAVGELDIAERAAHGCRDGAVHNAGVFRRVVLRVRHRVQVESTLAGGARY